MAEEKCIRVLLPLRLDWIPCYRSAKALPAGTRVSVVFARRRYVGVVWDTVTGEDVPENKLQEIEGVETGLHAVSGEEMRFWEFLSSYYLCTLGEVFKAAYPSGKVRDEKIAAGILGRLNGRLAVRREALRKKHRDSVRERLEGECRALEAQIEALTRIPDAETPKPAPGKPLLLTGEGRHEEYTNLCRETLQAGLNLLFLTPDHPSCTAAAEALEARFPGQVHHISSRVSETRRRAVCEDIRSYGAQIVVGTRSSIFLPFSRLGLIIVEDEANPLYKQTEPAPRYNARDASVMLARIHGAQVVLGAAAPSLESYQNALSGKYLQKDLPLREPSDEIIDIAAEKRKNGMLGPFSRKLLKASADSPAPRALVRVWEKEDELRHELETLLPGLEFDIFTPSEALLHGLGDYGLVALLQADALNGGESFRSDERAAQTIARLREQCRGRFIIQTAKASHPVFLPPGELYPRLLEERRSFGLPPFTRLVDSVCGSRRERNVLQPGAELASAKREIQERARAFEKKTGGRVRVILDVDPD